MTSLTLQREGARSARCGRTERRCCANDPVALDSRPRTFLPPLSAFIPFASGLSLAACTSFLLAGVCALLAGASVLLAGASVSNAAPPDHGWLEGDRGQILRLRGMTFVASEGSANEIVLHAEEAQFYPDHDVADLETVSVEVAPGGGRVGFEMKCERGRLNLSSQDFVAQGNVVGTIEGGRKFEALWVAYDEKDGILYTDEPVLITDENGSYRGGGFRYYVHQQRFRLMGGASIVQEP